MKFEIASRDESKAVIYAFLLFVFLRIFCFQGFSDSDSIRYAELANDLATGRFDLKDYSDAPVFPVRLGVYAPSAFLIKVFGLSEFSLVAYPLLISFSSALLIYTLTRRLYNATAATLALGIAAIIPIDVAYSSMLYGDLTAAFWSNLAVCICIYFVRERTIRGLHLKNVALAAAAGVALGIAWVTKEQTIYVFPFLIGLLLYDARTQLSSHRVFLYFAIIGAAILVFFVELTFYYINTGDPFFRFAQIAANHSFSASTNWFFREDSGSFGWRDGGYVSALLTRLLLTGPKAIFLNPDTAFIPGFAAIVIIIRILQRQRIEIIQWWFISMASMLNFMTTSFSFYSPIPIFENYLFPILFPAVIVVADYSSGLWGDIAKKSALSKIKLMHFFSLSAIVFSAILGLKGYFLQRPDSVERKAAKFIPSSTIVFSDPRSAALLLFYRERKLSEPSVKTLSWDKVSGASFPKGSYVLLNKTKLKFLSTNYGYQTPVFLVTASRRWRQVFADENSEIFVVE
jgi:4-amino-4-deoxy-L-arabinose transferase-like glycosyltransferase